MPGPIFQFLAEDHARLDAILTKASAGPGGVDLAAYGAFREGLLRHIALEEKILLPAARTARGGEPVPQARRLRVDHGAIAAPRPDAHARNRVSALQSERRREEP